MDKSAKIASIKDYCTGYQEAIESTAMLFEHMRKECEACESSRSACPSCIDRQLTENLNILASLSTEIKAKSELIAAKINEGKSLKDIEQEILK